MIFATVVDKSEIDEKSLKTSKHSDGISKIDGKKLDSGDSILVGYSFDSDKFDKLSVETWLAKNSIEYFNIEEDKENYSLDGVEILRTGTWNGVKFTKEDLDNIVQSYGKLKTKIKPYLKLGHDDNQKLLQSDGMPAAGWITNLRRSGESLLCKIENIPAKINKLIKDNRYGRFSSEVYSNFTESGEKYGRTLKAVALLGADTPAVTSMDDLITIYNSDEDQEVVFCDKETVEIKLTGDNMEQDLTKLSQEELLTKLKEANQRIEKVEQDRQLDKVEMFIQKQVECGKILPVQVPLYKELMSDTKVHKFSMDKDGEVKDMEMSTFSMVEKIIESMPSLVELSEQSENHQPENLTDDEKLDQEIKKYAKENNVEYGEAFDIVTAGGK